MSTPHHSPDEIDQIAATWVFRRDAGLSEAERDEFDQWLAQSPLHAEAIARFDRTWAALDRPRASGSCEAIEGLLAVGVRRQRRWRNTLAIAAVAAVCLTSIHLLRVDSPLPKAEVAVLNPESRVLSDGSTVMLKPGASLSVDFTASHRVIQLNEGEAFFEVVPESRPFVVTVGEVEFRAVGTAFSVNRASVQVELLVTEGRVAVAVATDDKPVNESGTNAEPKTGNATTFVDAGNLVVVALRDRTGDSPSPVSTTVSHPEISERLSWRIARLEFADIPLSEAVKVINEYSPSRLIIGDRELDEILVSGFFRADQTEGFVRLLEANFNVRTEMQGANTVLRRRP